MNTRISPSLLAADFSRLDRELAGVSSADAIHLDVMDGIFVPNLSFGPPVLQSIRKVTDLFFDVHLMIARPLDYVETFVKCGSDCITFHLESDSEPGETIRKIHSFGKKAGTHRPEETPGSVARCGKGRVPSLPRPGSGSLPSFAPSFESRAPVLQR